MKNRENLGREEPAFSRKKISRELGVFKDSFGESPKAREPPKYYGLSRSFSRNIREDLGCRAIVFTKKFCRSVEIDNVLDKSSFVLVEIWAVEPAFSRKKIRSGRFQRPELPQSSQNRGFESLSRPE